MAELIVRREGTAGWIVFSNPQKHNAVAYEMIRALPEAISKLDRAAGLHVIGLTGDGPDFVSGVDMSELGLTRGSIGATATYNAALEDAYGAIVRCRKPVLAAIRGACFGIGVSLAVYCDLRIAADDAIFAQLAARRGLGVSYSTVKRLVDLVGPAHAAEMLYTSRRYRAAEAGAIGLVNRVVAAAGLEHELAALCQMLSENAPLSITAAKHAIRAALADPGHPDLREVQAAIDACHASEDYEEGRAAFHEKRKPKFKGR
jgi:enoyl-CoA hydratase/carnithine racemase